MDPFSGDKSWCTFRRTTGQSRRPVSANICRNAKNTPATAGKPSTATANHRRRPTATAFNPPTKRQQPDTITKQHFIKTDQRYPSIPPPQPSFPPFDSFPFPISQPAALSVDKKTSRIVRSP